MKRIIFAWLFLILMVGTMLCACGTAKTENGAEQLSNTTAGKAASAKPKALQIVCYGDNRLIVTITDDCVETLFQGENDLQNIYVYFFLQNTQKASISINPYSWDFASSEKITDGGTPEIYINGQADTFKIEGNTVSFEVNQVGVGNLLSECDNYTAYYMDNKKDLQEMLAGGTLSDIVTSEESKETIELSYIGQNQAILRLSGEVFDNQLQGREFGLIEVNFYLSGSKEYVPDYVIKLQSGMDYLGAQLWQNTCQEMNDSSGSIQQTELIGESYNNAAKTADGFSAQIFYNDLQTLFSACDRISITDLEKTVLLEVSRESAVSNGTIEIPPVPEIFPLSSKDKEFFTPVTDDYIVTMLDMPLCPFFVYGYGWADGTEYYAPLDTREAPVKIVSITSYNEFGVADQRTKIIYDSIESAMTACAGRLDWYPAEELPEDEKAANDVLSNFFEELDKNIFGSPRAGESDYKYFGHYDNVRYFAANMYAINNLSFSLPNNIAYDQNTAFGEDGFYTQTAGYEYDFANFSINLSQIRESTAAITAYSSKADKKH